MVREKWRKTHFVFAHNLYMENIPFNAEELSLWWDLTQQPYSTKYGQTNIKWEIFDFKKKTKQHYYMSTASISRENTSVSNETPSHQKHVEFIIWWFNWKQCGWALVKQPDRRAALQSCSPASPPSGWEQQPLSLHHLSAALIKSSQPNSNSTPGRPALRLSSGTEAELRRIKGFLLLHSHKNAPRSGQ